MQGNPNALTPFPPQSSWSDPSFSECYVSNCYKTYGLYIFNSTYLFMYGAGLYSFFDNYGMLDAHTKDRTDRSADQGCLLTENCQEFMVGIEQSEGLYLYGLSTKAADTMIEVEKVALVPQEANDNNFCQVSDLRLSRSRLTCTDCRHL